MLCVFIIGLESLEPSITLEASNQDIELETCGDEIQYSKYLLTVNYFSLSWSFNISPVCYSSRCLFIVTFWLNVMI